MNNNKFIKFFKNKFNSYTYTLYKNKNESKFNKIRDNIITFKSYFEKEEKLINNLFGKNKFFIKNFDYNDFNYNLTKLKCNTDEIKIIKLFKISENKIIIITRENHEEIFGVEYDYDIIFKKYYYVYNVILFDINFEIKNILYSKKYLYNLKDNFWIHKFNDGDIIYSFDVNIINDNLFYINMYYSTKWYENKILNEFVIYNINKREFIIYELPFQPFNIWENYNFILTYKKNANFYLLFDSELNEFKVNKDGIQEIFYCNFNWKNDTASKYFFKFQDKIFYIVTNNYFYILRLKQ